MAGTVHPGADDNASGTAGVMELARWFSQNPKHKRGFLFLTFAGEELGLLGSGWYADHPELPLQNAVAMINMDIIDAPQTVKLLALIADIADRLSEDPARPQLVRVAPPQEPAGADPHKSGKVSGYGPDFGSI